MKFEKERKNTHPKKKREGWRHSCLTMVEFFPMRLSAPADWAAIRARVANSHGSKCFISAGASLSPIEVQRFMANSCTHKKLRGSWIHVKLVRECVCACFFFLCVCVCMCVFVWGKMESRLDKPLFGLQLHRANGASNKMKTLLDVLGKHTQQLSNETYREQKGAQNLIKTFYWLRGTHRIWD